MKTMFVLAAACLLSQPLLSQERSSADTTRSSSHARFASDPEEAQFHTEDIVRFWDIYDRSTARFRVKVLQREYLEQGSAGLRGFIPNRIGSGRKLARTLRKNRSYYESIRAASLAIAQHQENFYAAFRQLEQLYPAAVFPDVYFVIGRRNTGGAIFSGGLIIGVERFGLPGPGFKPDIDSRYLDDVVAHELIHFQQNYVRDNSLLAQCIREGAADFLGELIAGSHTNAETYRYGDAHEATLREEFMQRKDGTDWSGWLYYAKDTSRPKDLGYWIGYKICKAYYEQMDDKHQAVSDILNIRDFSEFLQRSGY